MFISEMLQPSGFLIASLIVTYFILKPRKTYTDPYDDALKYLGFGEHKKAISSLNKAIKENPDNVDAYYYRSRTYCALEKIGKASSDAETMIEEFPDSNLGYIARSKIQKQLGNLEQANQDLALAVKIQPQTVEEYQKRIALYKEIGQLNDAINDLSTLLDDLDYKKYEIYFNRGTLYLEKSHYNQALEDFNFAYKHAIGQKKRSQILLIRSGTYGKLADLENALKDFDEYIYINPNKTIGYDLRSKFHFSQENHQLALEDFKKFLLLEPNNMSLYLLIGISYSQLGQHENAIEAFTVFLKFNENSAPAYNSRAWSKAHLKNYYGSSIDAQKALSLDDSKSYFYGTLGQARWLMKDYNDALESYNQALDLESLDIFKLEKSITLAKLDKQDEAISLWLEATSEDAEFQSAEAYQDKYRFAPPFYEAMQALEKLAKNTD